MANTKKNQIITDKDKYEIKNKEVITVRPNTLHSKSAKQLAINEQRILFYSIYRIQHSQNTVSFTKQELKESFGVDFGSYKDIKKYLTSLRSFGIDIEREGSERLMFINAFNYLIYNQGVFEFKFSDDFLPVIGQQKRFLQLGMQSIEKFKSHYSSYFYQWLKDNMWGNKRVIPNIGLSDFKAIFKLEPDAYKGDNSHFKSRVWMPALREINAYTNYDIKIETKGRGKTLRFTITRIQNEDLAQQQISLKRNESKSGQNFECKLGVPVISSHSCSQCMRINRCPLPVSGKSWAMIPEPDADNLVGLQFFLYYTFWDNEYYDLMTRIKNGVACQEEKEYYKWIEIAESDEVGTPVSDEDMKRAIKEEKKNFYETFIGMDIDEGSE